MTFPSKGTRVRICGTYLDEALTQPLEGTVADVFPDPDRGGGLAYVVMFDHDDTRLPPGGEFSLDRLLPAA